MSDDIGLSYSASTQPSSIDVQFNLGFSNTTLKATIASVPPFIITLTPSGNVAQEIVSGIAWPLAQLMGTILPPLASNLIDGYSFDIITVSPSTQTIGGEQMTVTPSNLNLGMFNGMLMVSGSIGIS